MSSAVQSIRMVILPHRLRLKNIASLVVACLSLTSTLPVFAEPPRSSYIFPAGAQRGTKCRARVGGLFIHEGTRFEMFGPQISRQGRLRPTETIWFDNPVLNPPTAEGGDDRPRDFLVDLDIPADAEEGSRHWRLWTSQGATASKPFIVGDLPEIVEEEIDGRPVPVQVVAPLTINGRIFPSEDVDVWRFKARAGETWQLSVCAVEIGSPLRARLQLFGPDELRIAITHGTPDRDPQLRFTAVQEGVHEVRIDDVRLDHTVANGGFHRAPPQSSVYRLSVARQWNVASVFPLGGQRGKRIRAELQGEGLPAEPVTVLLPSSPSESWNTRLTVREIPTSPVSFELSDFDEVLEQEPNEEPSRAAKITWPTVINGRIGHPGDSDTFRLSLRKGQTCDFDLRATRLRSALDGVLTIRDANGRELSRDESLAEGQNDPSLRFTAPADGEYLVGVAGRLASRGGAAYAYRLYVTSASSDFQLLLPRDAVTILRGAAPEAAATPPRRRPRRRREDPVTSRLPVVVEAAGPLLVPVRLSVEGLPTGVKLVEGSEIAAGSLQTELVFTAAEGIPIQACLITIRGTAELDKGKPPVVRTAFRQSRGTDPAIDHVRLAVAIPTPFKIRGATDYTQAPRGTVCRWHYLIDRTGYDGPLTVQLSDHQPRQLQGMFGPTITVPSGQNFCTYPARLAPWMAAGRASRSAVMGFANVTDRDGSSHVVYYSAEDARSQIYMLVTAGPYSIETVESTQSVRPGMTIPIRVRINREAGFRSGVRITLHPPPHMRGLSAEPMVIPSHAAEGTMQIRCTAPLGPFNMPITLRGISLDTPEQIETETQFELVDAR